MAIQKTNSPHGGRVYYVPAVEETQLGEVATILGSDFAEAARYYAAGKRVYTNELPPETKQNLAAAGYEARTGLHKI